MPKARRASVWFAVTLAHCSVHCVGLAV